MRIPISLLIGAGAWHTLDVIRRPLRKEQLSPVLDQLRTEMQPGDRVYVYYSAVPAFTFYTRDKQFPPEAVTLGTEFRENSTAGYRGELNQLHGRVWVIFSHPHKHEETIIRSMIQPCR